LIGCGTLDALRKKAELNGSLEDVFLKLTEEAFTPADNKTSQIVGRVP
jgi:hypothetical protein